MLGGEPIADSNDVYLYRHMGMPPVCFFPGESVRTDALMPSEEHVESELGTYNLYSAKLGDANVPDAAWSFVEPNADVDFLKGMYAFKWQAMDSWFEEEDEIFGHIRDPFKRIDTVRSQARIEVVVDGEVVADTSRATLLLEPALPVRYYIPADDVRMDLLQATETTSLCPYKGDADYFTATVGNNSHEDVAWTYKTPLREAVEVANMICFFNERVSAIRVDGEEAIKPVTPWSNQGDGHGMDTIPMTPWGPPRTM